jgi:hypothetical protein
MKPGRYAAPDGSFARSAGGAGARGLALLALALLIGVVLLNATDADPPGTNVSASGAGSHAASSDDEGGDGSSSASSTTTAAPTTTTLPAHAPKDVKVIVANASAVKGAASGGRTALLAAQYNVLAPTNAAAVPDSSVYFTPGYDRDAAAVATALGLAPPTVKPMPAPAPFDTKGANVAVVLGADAAPRFGTAGATTTTAAATATTARPAAGATTTTARPAAGATTTTAPAATTTTKKP